MVWSFPPLPWEGSKQWPFSNCGCGLTEPNWRCRTYSRAWLYTASSLRKQNIKSDNQLKAKLSHNWDDKEHFVTIRLKVSQFFLCKFAYEECTQLQESWICTEVSICFHFWSFEPTLEIRSSGQDHFWNKLIRVNVTTYKHVFFLHTE